LKPYYEEKGITIYHGDCREILPTLAKVDLVLTDPPYGIGRDGNAASTSSHGGRKPHEFFSGWDKEPPSADVFKAIFKAADNQIIWGANYFTIHLPASMGWLVWDKGQDICSSDCELAFTSRDAALRRKVMNRCELLKDGTNHPTQKPLALMSWCISFFPDAKTILDPFMGSGTTLRAAKDLGRQAIGIELEEKYCEIAAKRLSQEVFAL
jgi:DNA modification methylase